ncbi:MAG: Lrp/AsnC ligand binding domain-containing protein [Sphingomonas fennica]
MRAHREVVDCRLVSGGFDDLLKFVVRNVQYLRPTIEPILDSNNGINKHLPYIVIKSPISNGRAPIRSLFVDKPT